ncbi:MAG TPA: SAM-dependent methyltransferase [Myxococcales bacterium]|jgi:caffeoyl-CoA O-methyltransferase|nr:SAM-dependent methyltransferase [Myxococcales bacterium]HIM03433.1 SAM-dependent methyltransferase [Myxococcales bacterium]
MSDNPKSFNLSPELHSYMLAHGTAPDAIQQGLIEATSKLGGISVMQIAPEQGALMTMLTQLIGATRAIEVGTFTGYSALCIARGLPKDGQLVCCDISDEWTSVGVPFWEKAGVRDRIDLRIAPALETLQGIKEDDGFDLAFIDADKPSYQAYVEELLRLVRPGGLILVDNVLWGGNVINAENNEDNTLAIRAFNEKIAKDPRVDCVMLAISDGLTFLRVI